MTDKGSCSLSEGSIDIVSDVFKIHSNCRACGCLASKSIDRGLDKDIGNAENSTLQSSRNSNLQNFFCNPRSANVIFGRKIEIHPVRASTNLPQNRH